MQLAEKNGVWTTEPDRLEFEAHGLPCWILRMMHSGHLCGYVAVPPGHPWWGRDHETRAEVHGGVTFGREADGFSPCPDGELAGWWVLAFGRPAPIRPDPDGRGGRGLPRFGVRPRAGR